MVAANPAVDLDLVANLAAQQLMNGNAQRLALDVPHGLLQTGDRARQDGAAAIEAAAVEHLEGVLDLRGVLADELLGQLAHARLNGLRLALDNRLTPAGQAG